VNDDILGQPNEILVVIARKMVTATVDEERGDRGPVPDRAADVQDHVIVAPDHVNVKNIAAEDRR
jgi:hypothetical protein